MKKRILVSILAAVLVVSLASALLAGKRKHPSKLKYPPLELKTPEWVELAFDNGLEGFLIENHEIPVVDVVLLIKTYFPDKEKYGLNTMAQWVMRNGGTETWPSDKLNDELEFLAARIEVYGGDLSTMIAFNCLKKDLSRILGIFADLLMNPAFPEDKVEMKRKTMLEDILRKNDQPRDVARREYFKLIYGDHPYGYEITTASVNAVTRGDLVAFHEKYFHPGNAIIGISGDVTEAEITEAMGNALAAWDKADVSIPKVPDVTVEPKPGYNYAYKEINQAYIMLGHLGINDNNPDKCAIEIMNFILGGGSFTSWITETVRSDKGLAYSTGSRYGADAFAKGAFYAYAQTKADEYSRAMELIVEQIERMRSEGPTEEEVKKAVDSYLNSHVFEYESTTQVVRRLVRLRFYGQPLDSPEKDMETYAKLTVADINRVAKEYLHPDRLTVFVVGDEEQFDRPLSDFGEVNVIELEEE
jgi:predicted Zn-dependent peptidase